MLYSQTFPLAAMGVLAPESAHAGPCAQPPINTSRNVSACKGTNELARNKNVILNKEISPHVRSQLCKDQFQHNKDVRKQIKSSVEQFRIRFVIFFCKG